MTGSLNPAASQHLPAFITAPGDTDVLYVFTTIFLVCVVLAAGNLFLRLHTLPERMMHKSEKLQFEIVAVLGLLALFTHIHLFWVAGLLLAFADLPDFLTPLTRIADSSEKVAGLDSSAAEAKALSEPKARSEAEAPAGGEVQIAPDHSAAQRGA